MPSAFMWEAPSAASTVINGDASAPTLKNLANNGQKLGAEVDNATAEDRWAEFELYVRGALAFDATGYIELYLQYAFDGTNYADGDDSVAPSGVAFVGAWPVRAVATQQRLPPLMVPILPFKFKPLIINKGGQAFTNTDNENVLKVRTFNEEAQ